MIRIERGAEVAPGVWEYFSVRVPPGLWKIPSAAVGCLPTKINWRSNRSPCRGIPQWVGRGRYLLRDKGRSGTNGFGTVWVGRSGSSSIAPSMLAFPSGGRVMAAKLKRKRQPSGPRGAIIGCREIGEVDMDKAEVICKVHEIADHYLLGAGTWPADQRAYRLFSRRYGI